MHIKVLVCIFRSVYKVCMDNMCQERCLSGTLGPILHDYMYSIAYSIENYYIYLFNQLLTFPNFNFNLGDDETDVRS